MSAENISRSVVCRIFFLSGMGLARGTRNTSFLAFRKIWSSILLGCVIEFKSESPGQSLICGRDIWPNIFIGRLLDTAELDSEKRCFQCSNAFFLRLLSLTTRA